jgi:hypothetical protein
MVVLWLKQSKKRSLDETPLLVSQGVVGVEKGSLDVKLPLAILVVTDVADKCLFAITIYLQYT